MLRSPSLGAHALSTASSSSSSSRLSCPQRSARPARRGLVTVAVGWDPENILAQPKGGHIARRQMQKQMGSDKAYAEQVAVAREEARKEVTDRRTKRTPPSQHDALVDYFLNTLGEDMQFEVARTRPLITPEFLAHLDRVVANERFKPSPNQDKLAELEGLRDFLKQAVESLDATVQQMSSAMDRMKALLMSPDKKAAILEMAEKNEIDRPLIDLLRQNAAAARSAGQEEPAKFMEKVMMAASKYLIEAPVPKA